MAKPVTIIAELAKWSLDDERMNVEGTITNSADITWYPNGERRVFLNINIAHYPYTADGDDYWLIRTQIGNYFKLKRSQMA